MDVKLNAVPINRHIVLVCRQSARGFKQLILRYTAEEEEEGGRRKEEEEEEEEEEVVVVVVVVVVEKTERQ